MNSKIAIQAELDIHQLSPNEAKKFLCRYLSNLPAEVKEVTVIHGCHHGTLLMQMVQKELRHPRIKTKIKSLNQGITVLSLT